MRQWKRFLSAWCLSLLFAVILFIPSAAKTSSPSNVTSLSAKASESSVKLTWKKAKNATAYEIYMKVGVNGTYKRIVTTKKTSYTRKSLTPGKTYYFRIRSVRTKGSQKYYSTSYSKTVKATPSILKPGTPSSFKVYKTDSKKMYFSWKKAKNATGYAIYKYDSALKKYTLAAKTKSTSGTVMGLTGGKTYSFKIRSYRTVNGVTRYGSYSSVIKKKAPQMSEAVSAIHPIWYKATVLANVTANPANAKTKKQLVKKGTKVTVIGYGSVCKVRLPNGGEVYIRLSSLKFTSSVYTTKSYSRSLKEDYVNQSGYSSPTKYLIWVSTYTQEFCLYTGSQGKWKLLRTAKIATGKAESPTAARICSIRGREERWTYENGTYQAPVVYFHGGNAFHSRLHNPDGSLASKTIGKPVSGGCVRMYDDDIQYIYKNCPDKTTVVIY